MSVEIVRARVTEPDVTALLNQHFALMRMQSPADSCHVLAADELGRDDICLYALRDAGMLQAVGALRLVSDWGEVKSMHTAQNARGQGVARMLLAALISEARVLGLSRLNLETGSGPEHLAARRLYARAGFASCPPFGSYKNDPLSHFMSLAI